MSVFRSGISVRSRAPARWAGFQLTRLLVALQKPGQASVPLSSRVHRPHAAPSQTAMCFLSDQRFKSLTGENQRPRQSTRL